MSAHVLMTFSEIKGQDERLVSMVEHENTLFIATGRGVWRMTKVVDGEHYFKPVMFVAPGPVKREGEA